MDTAIVLGIGGATALDYLSDVVFGAAMGIAAQRTVTLHSRRYDMAMIPAAAPGYASVTMTVRTR